MISTSKVSLLFTPLFESEFVRAFVGNLRAFVVPSLERERESAAIGQRTHINKASTKASCSGNHGAPLREATNETKETGKLLSREEQISFGKEGIPVPLKCPREGRERKQRLSGLVLEGPLGPSPGCLGSLEEDAVLWSMFFPPPQGTRGVGSPFPVPFPVPFPFPQATTTSCPRVHCIIGPGRF